MYIHTYAYVHTDVYVCIHVYISTYIYVDTYTYMYIYICVYIFTYMCTARKKSHYLVVTCKVYVTCPPADVSRTASDLSHFIYVTWRGGRSKLHQHIKNVDMMCDVRMCVVFDTNDDIHILSCADERIVRVKHNTHPHIVRVKHNTHPHHIHILSCADERI